MKTNLIKIACEMIAFKLSFLRSICSFTPKPHRYLVLRPDGAQHAVRLSGEAMIKEFYSRQNYIAFTRNETGWLIDKVVRDAVSKGQGVISGHVFGDVWPTDPYCRKKLAEAIAPLGFSVRYVVHESDGPEADRFSLIVEPAKELQRI